MKSSILLATAVALIASVTDAQVVKGGAAQNAGAAAGRGAGHGGGQGIGRVLREGEQLLQQLELAQQLGYGQGAYGGDYGGDYSSMYGDVATTPIQGISYGIAKIIRAAGEFNLLSSQALLNLTEVRRREIENWRIFTTTYFELRRVNREYRALERGPRLTETELIHIAQMGKPRRLTPSELDTISGQIAWPIVLQAVEFAQHREQMNRIFAERAANGVLGLDQYLTADRSITTMQDLLRRHIFDIPPADYMVARRFLESLVYEARFPAI